MTLRLGARTPIGPGVERFGSRRALGEMVKCAEIVQGAGPSAPRQAAVRQGGGKARRSFKRLGFGYQRNHMPAGRSSGRSQNANLVVMARIMTMATRNGSSLVRRQN